MAAASSKLRSPLWTPSTELSKAQQKSWPEAHYLSNAPLSLTDRCGRAHAGTPYALCLTGQKRTRAVLSRPFQTRLQAFQLEKYLLGDRSQPGYSNRVDAGIWIEMWECNGRRCFPAETFNTRHTDHKSGHRLILQSDAWPTISTVSGCTTGDHNDSQQIHRVCLGKFTCCASQKQASALTTHVYVYVNT